MRYSARHLPQRAQAFLLYDDLLGLLEILIGLLQGSIKLRLVGRERNMLAELAKKLAFPAAKALLLAACRHKHAENLALNLQRSQHEGAQAAAREPLRKRKLQSANVGFIDKLAQYAARKAVLVDVDPGPFGHGEFKGDWAALDSDAGDRQHVIDGVVKAQTGEIDG
jgi:hypothetical protein